MGYHYYLIEEQRVDYGREVAGVMVNPDLILPNAPTIIKFYSKGDPGS